jgi:hypothetical protein
MVMLLISTLLLLSSAVANAQCCGDCNQDGQVAINELITAVGNGLHGCSIAPTPSVSAATPTPLPDQCATDPVGTHLTALGTDYIVVEVEVVLEDSQQTYLLRYPAPLDVNGHLYSILNPIYLRPSCETPYLCAARGDQRGSICGFPTIVHNYRNPTTSYSETAGGTPKWLFSFGSYREVSIIADAEHQPITLSIGIYSRPSETLNVAPLSDSDYSFATANFPEPSASDLAKMEAQLDSLVQHISLERATLPVPPIFPGL